MMMAAIQPTPASPMAHLLEKDHVPPHEQLTIDLYQREALKDRVPAAPLTCNAEGARLDDGHWDNIPGASRVVSSRRRRSLRKT
jgi:hypothetical protein